MELLPYADWHKKDVRIRENIRQIDEDLYEYDEYRIIAVDSGTLEHDIRENLETWVASCRTAEYDETASIAADMAEALAILGVTE